MVKTLTADFDINVEADVLVIGGGPAGTWAAWRAASSGASVILVDKGYCGTTGCAAASGNGVWYVPEEAEARYKAMASRESLGGFLANRHWMERVLEQTYANVNLLAEWGYPFPTDDEGKPYRRSLQGPEYMRLMRKQIKRFGVQILDHSPALELLVDNDGAVGGARGVNRQTGNGWEVRSRSVIIATGGCAFLSKALGCNVLTGDGYLMAAEAGVEMSGMEFSNAYGISPALERRETRGMHKHLDYPEQDANQQHYLISGGLDRVWVKAQSLNNGKSKVFNSNLKIGEAA